MGKGDKVGLVQVLDEIKSGLSPAQIVKKYSIPKQNVSYFVGKLKEKGCIQKKGYGVWGYIRPLKEVKEVKDLTTRHYQRPTSKSLTSQPKREIRGHAFIWKIQFLKNYNWDNVVKNYKKKKLTFQYMQHNKIWRTIFNNRKVWLGRKGMTIYEPIDFLGKSSFEVKGRAVFEMDLLIKQILQELGLKLLPYRFTTSREHYGIVKNELARQYNDKKQKMHIRSEDGTIWMWIDDSKGLGELENCDPTINRQVQNYWNNHKDHNFKVDASFILNGFDKLTKAIQHNADNLGYYADHLQSHVASVQVLGRNVDVLGGSVDDQNAIQLKTLSVLEKMEKRLERLEHTQNTNI